MAKRAEGKAVEEVDVEFDAMMAGLADQTAETERADNFRHISTKGGRFKLDEVTLGDTIRCVVLAAVFENHYYAKKYDPKSQDNQQPACQAIGRVRETMIPMPGPNVQAESCVVCKHNQFGSAEDGGKGKRCRNYRTLAVLLEADMGNKDKVMDNVSFLRIPPTSMSGYAEYAKKVALEQRLPPFGVITQVHLEPDDDRMFDYQFSFVGKIADKALVKAFFEASTRSLLQVAGPVTTSPTGYPLPLDTDRHAGGRED